MELWEDRSVEFCLPGRKLRICSGEMVIDVFSKVVVLETWGGGSQEYEGRLILTNLRIMWVMGAMKSLNVSIGHHRITAVKCCQAKSYQSKFSGRSHGIQVHAKQEKAYLFKFLATDRGKEFSELCDKICTTHKAHTSSAIYRNLTLRSTITTEDDKLCLLPKEEIYNTVDGFWNLSGNFGNLGMLFITNIRMVWFSKENKHYNASIPYIRIKSIQDARTKFGHTLIVKLMWPYSDLVFAFQVSPEERLRALIKELLSMRAVALENPNFGVFVESKGDTEIDMSESCGDVVICEEDTDIDQAPALHFSSLASFESEPGAHRKPGPPVYSKELGLAMESLPSGHTIDSLWRVF